MRGPPRARSRIEERKEGGKEEKTNEEGRNIRRDGDRERVPSEGQTLFLLVPSPEDNDGIYVCSMRTDRNSHETEVTDITI